MQQTTTTDPVAEIALRVERREADEHLRRVTEHVKLLRVAFGDELANFLSLRVGVRPVQPCITYRGMTYTLSRETAKTAAREMESVFAGPFVWLARSYTERQPQFDRHRFYFETIEQLCECLYTGAPWVAEYGK